MRPRIAIPIPFSGNPEYVERSLPQYERALEVAGGAGVRIPLDQPPSEVMKIIERCDAVLLPGSSADVDPAKYDAPRDKRTVPADPQRDTVDELLLQDAYNMRKPILGICYGLQILNVYRTGSLIQHIDSTINHAAGRKIAIAHEVVIEPQSKLAEIVTPVAKFPHPWLKPEPATEEMCSLTARSDSPERPDSEGHDLSRIPPAGERLGGSESDGNLLLIPVNSSHHQSAAVVGDGLRVVARCPNDGIIEAIEGTAPNHFVLAVQWHPERSFDDDEPSRAIFRALVGAARERHRDLAGKFESLT